MAVVIGVLLAAMPSASSTTGPCLTWQTVADATPSPLAAVALAASQFDQARLQKGDGGGPRQKLPVAATVRTPGGSWTLVERAADDFEGSKIDRSTWGVYEGKGNAGVGLRRPAAVSQSSGELKITAAGDVSGGMAQRSGQTYGRWEVRARMDRGTGYGPAILLWPDSERWPQDGEIDIVEVPRGDRTRAVMTVHYGANNRQKGTSALGDFSKWHTYAVDWTPEHVIFYIDGIEQYRVTDPQAIPSTPMHLAIQNDVGKCGSWIGCRDASTPEKVALHVSSVRVYAKAGD